MGIRYITSIVVNIDPLADDISKQSTTDNSFKRFIMYVYRKTRHTRCGRARSNTRHVLSHAISCFNLYKRRNNFETTDAKLLADCVNQDFY